MIKLILSIILGILFFISCIILSTAYTGKKLAIKPEDITYYDTLSTVGIVLFILDVISIVIFTYYYYYYIRYTRSEGTNGGGKASRSEYINTPKKLINKQKMEPILNDIYKIKLAKRLLDASTKKNAIEICDKLINQSTDTILIEQFNKMKINRSEYEILNLCQNYSKSILGTDYHLRKTS